MSTAVIVFAATLAAYVAVLVALVIAHERGERADAESEAARRITNGGD